MKQLIDRLRAEIAFLREQLKCNRAESNDRTTNEKTRGARDSRLAEREVELQNQLLDLQENYTALSQRHAKVISEITRATDREETRAHHTEYADSAVDRIKRSNSFAEAVEQVVLEYEKTIQSLETSLTSTRSSLSNSESTLLEKESRLAYVETVNQQLQTRLQKMVDRESSTETYLRDLETRLSGHTSGEEKNSAIVRELQKEIARVRENEAGCEDYISTLEERLAESEQDMELMQREIDRLEHVIDRQRSLGKLDHLLLELDNIKDKEKAAAEPSVETNDEEGRTPVPSLSSKAESIRSEPFSEDRNHPTLDISRFAVRSPTPPAMSGTPPILESVAEDDYLPASKDDEYQYMPQSPAQSQFVADKFETVQQELFDLKVEHEQTLQEFEQVTVNYEQAMRNIATMRDQLDELRHAKKNLPVMESVSRGTSPPESPEMRPISFLADARVNGLKGSEEQLSSSLSLSSELSLVGVSHAPPGYTETDENALKIHLETETEREVTRASTASPDDLLKKFEVLVKEKEELERAAEEEQQSLQRELSKTRDELAELKSGNSPRNSSSPSPSQFLRRKSSPSLAVVDRAQRAFTSLRRLANEHLSALPEVLENFELNIDGAMRELQNRLERISELEQEVHSLRKEMESKSAMIAGLTRERTSIQTSPMDISVVAVMQRRIDETEAQLYKTSQSLADRERELASARGAVESIATDSPANALSLLDELTKERRLTSDQAAKILELHNDLEQLRSGQFQALDSLQESKQALEKTLRDLEIDLSKTKEASMQNELDIRVSYDQQLHDYQRRVDVLQENIADNKETINSQLTRVSELEKCQSDTNRQIESLLASESSSKEQIEQLQIVNMDLQQNIAQNKELIESQQRRLGKMEHDYDEAVKQLEVLREEKVAALTALKEAEERARAEAAAAAAQHEELLAAVRGELAESRETGAAHAEKLVQLQESYDKLQVSYDEVQASYNQTQNETSVAADDGIEAKEDMQRQFAAQKEELERQLAEQKETIAEHVSTLKELQMIQDQREAELKCLGEKEKKHAKLVEDLEQELTFTFDQNQESSKKLATVTHEFEKAKQERDALAALSEQESAESQKVIESLNEEIMKLRVRLAVGIHMRMNGLLTRRIS